MKSGIVWRAFLAAWLMLPPGARAGEPATVRGENVVVRSQPTRFSPIVTHLSAGAAVTVLEEITLEKPVPGDEAKWVKITFPTNATAWVLGMFVDTNLNTVLPARLNVRAGPGENYPVVGRLERGDVIKSLGVKNEWIEFAPVTNAYAFVAASFVNLPKKDQPAAEALATPAPTVTNEVVATTNVPAAVQASAPLTPVPALPVTNEIPAATAVVSTTTETTAPPKAAATAAPQPVPEPLVPEPPKPRVVTREGRVSGLTSIQAPSYFKLDSLDNGRTMNYLHTTSTNLVLRRYLGKHVLVTGEEALDERWPATPVITIQRIRVLEP